MQQTSKTSHPPIVVIVGPTAGGKTDLSLRLARSLPCFRESDADGAMRGEVISADSMQVYIGMDIGTAKPTVGERGDVPHHLIDCVEPDQPFTVHDWRQEAEQVIADIRAGGRWPIIVGGTNLYVKALLMGMFEGPDSDPALRAELEGLANEQLHERLRAVDPEGAARIHRNDRKRAIRAIEVHTLTGQSISDLQKEWEGQGQMRRDALLIGLDWPVELINQRINARVKTMVESGLVEEVRALSEAGRLGPQAREALGYKQVLAYLEGHCSQDDAIERIKIETRRFARKQRTWLKGFRVLRPSIWLPASELTPADLAAKAADFALSCTPGRKTG